MSNLARRDYQPGQKGILDDVRVRVRVVRGGSHPVPDKPID